MRRFWPLWLCPLLLQAAQLSPVPRTEEGLPRGPKPFSSNHYDLLMEYSPFVKSVEAAKETEKSPELVVVGYGRIAGESHVIIQSKDNSEKREKIGSRFGSKDFPYRLLSVTNASDRKKFLAVLEDRNNRKLKIYYTSESAPASPPATNLDRALFGNTPDAVARRRVSTDNPQQLLEAALGNSNPAFSAEQLQQQIQDLDVQINKPDLSEAARKRGIERREMKKKQLQALQNPQEINATTTPLEGAP